MDVNTFFHNGNIIIHVIAGSIALLLGIIALVSKKGNSMHKKRGKLFLGFLTIVVVSVLIGVFVFKRNVFLFVIMALSAYLCFLGFRVLKHKTNTPFKLNIAILTLITVSYFLYYFKTIGMIWSSVIIYSTVGYLLFILSYDFLRYAVPAKRYKNLWVYGHILKMVCAFSALLSAFTGTVFENYQPYSQFLPSTFGLYLAIGVMIFYYRKAKRNINL